MAQQDYEALLSTLLAAPGETEWIEFKLNNESPQEIGEQISALANAAALHRRDRAFVVWGVDDGSHQFVGTKFQPANKKVGNEDLENWIATQLTPRVQFWIHTFQCNGNPGVIFEIEPATHQPIAFRGVEYIRVGKYTKRLREHPEKERALWRSFSRESFEAGIEPRAAPPPTTYSGCSAIRTSLRLRIFRLLILQS